MPTSPASDREWLLVVFTSATCDTCADVARKAKVSESAAVAVAEIEWGANRPLHERYGIDAVPTTVLADRDGVVRASFLGPVTATDLWAAVAEAREPGSSPSPTSGGSSLQRSLGRSGRCTTTRAHRGSASSLTPGRAP